MILSIHNICELVSQGFTDWKQYGEVSVKDLGFAYLFNYNPLAHYKGEWTPFERMSRGLIIQKDGKILARPFSKFFNWGERGKTTDAPISYVMEKMDGSMGAAWFNRNTQQWQVSTRGSITNEQSRWATKKMKDYDISGFGNCSTLMNHVLRTSTLIVEIIYPENRVVVDYQGRAELVLLAIRNNLCGTYETPEVLRQFSEHSGMPLAPMYEFSTVDQILETLDQLSANEEGFVAVFKNGQRFKFKGDAYKLMHKQLSGISYAKTVECVMEGKVDHLLSIVPDEWLDEVKGWLSEIHDNVEQIKNKVQALREDLPEDVGARELALAMKEKLAKEEIDKFLFGCIMRQFRGHNIDQQILKHLHKSSSKSSLLFDGKSA